MRISASKKCCIGWHICKQAPSCSFTVLSNQTSPIVRKSAIIWWKKRRTPDSFTCFCSAVQRPISCDRFSPEMRGTDEWMQSFLDESIWAWYNFECPQSELMSPTLIHPPASTLLPRALLLMTIKRAIIVVYEVWKTVLALQLHVMHRSYSILEHLLFIKFHHCTLNSEMQPILCSIVLMDFGFVLISERKKAHWCALKSRSVGNFVVFLLRACAI